MERLKFISIPFHLVQNRRYKMLRIIEKETYLFTRDDFTFDPETEIGLDVEPAQGLFKPKWSCEITVVEGTTTEDEEGNIIVGEGEWVEGATQEEIAELTKPQPHEPTEIDLLQAQVQASSDYVDLLEEVVVELIQEVYK